MANIAQIREEKMILVKNDNFEEVNRYLDTHDWYIEDYQAIASPTGDVYVYVHLCSRISVSESEWDDRERFSFQKRNRY